MPTALHHVPGLGLMRVKLRHASRTQRGGEAFGQLRRQSGVTTFATGQHEVAGDERVVFVGEAGGK
jgi:hypothetical protein